MDTHTKNNKNNPINYEQTQKERNNIIICETLERLCQEYLPDLDTPLNFICKHIQEEITEYHPCDIRENLYDNGFFDEEIIYYHKAMKYLSEHDNSLYESIDIACEMGYDLKNLNSETLASLHATKRNQEIFDDYIYDKLEEAFNNLLPF